MSKNDNPCSVAHCSTPSDEYYVCLNCAHDMETILKELYVWLLEDLRIVVTKQTKSEPKNGSRATETTPLPYHPEASKLYSDTSSAILRFLGQWSQSRPNPIGGIILANENTHLSTKQAAKHLSNHTHDLRLFTETAEFIEVLDERYSRIKRIIDRPPPKWYIGKCSAEVGESRCKNEIYASTNKGFVTCSDCGTRHDIEQRRHDLIEKAKTLSVTATEAANAIHYWTDIPVGTTRQLMNRIAQWAKRGRLVERGHIMERGHLRPIYTLGDILNLLTEQLTRGRD